MYIGIDLGGTNIAAGIASGDGRLLLKGSMPTRGGAEEIVRDMALLAKKLMTEYGITAGDIKAVGIGCPGTVSFRTGEVIYSNNIRMKHFPMADKFKEHIDLPVRIDNDANCAAMGEYAVNGNNAGSFLFITLGTGVGSGLVLGGKIYRGFNGAATEAGHITVVSDGEPCTCGKRGCWEAYASATALIRDTERAMRTNPGSLMNELAEKEGMISGRTAFDAAKLGDAAGKTVVARYIRYIADGIVSCENFLQPEIIAIGGGISREGDYLLNPIREYIRAHRFNKFMPETKLVTAKLYNDAGIIGAAMMAREE